MRCPVTLQSTEQTKHMKTTKDMLDYIEGECKAVDREERFDQMLDECYSFDSVGGPFEHMSPSSVLKEVDPIAYRCGVNDWADSERWYEIGSDYYDSDEVHKARDEFIDELESELSELEDELDNLADELEEFQNKDEIEIKEGQITNLKTLIKECENYAF